jgi:hypothetical protein
VISEINTGVACICTLFLFSEFDMGKMSVAANVCALHSLTQMLSTTFAAHQLAQNAEAEQD